MEDQRRTGRRNIGSEMLMMSGRFIDGGVPMCIKTIAARLPAGGAANFQPG